VDAESARLPMVSGTSPSARFTDIDSLAVDDDRPSRQGDAATAVSRDVSMATAAFVLALVGLAPYVVAMVASTLAVVLARRSRCFVTRRRAPAMGMTRASMAFGLGALGVIAQLVRIGGSTWQSNRNDGASTPVTAIMVDNAPPSPSAEPPSLRTAPLALEQSTDDIEVGGCYDVPKPGGLVDTVIRVPCNTPHYSEAMAVFSLPQNDFASFEQMDSLFTARCEAAFEPYVGLDYDLSPMMVEVLIPTVEQWRVGLTVDCLAIGPGLLLDESVRRR
jgi:membrane protein implicated in regulation of membrane protease activity